MEKPWRLHAVKQPEKMKIITVHYIFRNKSRTISKYPNTRRDFTQTTRFNYTIFRHPEIAPKKLIYEKLFFYPNDIIFLNM